MPDRRRHRGRHPADEELFAEVRLRELREAVLEHSWLLTRGYAHESALKLVGDRHSLTARQRFAVLRCACPDQSVKRRAMSMVAPADCRGAPLAIDGYNLLITVESALSGGVILIGRDGCYRDLAGVHGTYRKVEETAPALEAIMEHVEGLGVSRVNWYLDRPVSNSGRLKVLIAELVETRQNRSTSVPGWNIELVDSPDALLAACSHAVATSDSAVLDKCSVWVNLAAAVIDKRAPGAWKIDLRGSGGERGSNSATEQAP